MAARATQQTAELGSKKTPGQSHVKTDLPDATKWAPGDIKEYGRVMTEVQGDIKEIKEQRKLLQQSLKELESSMLKGLSCVLRPRLSTNARYTAGTRKEEIIRFTRAQTDSEFAKMLKIRTLGPEYLETQSQLRRDIRVQLSLIHRIVC